MIKGERSVCVVVHGRSKALRTLRYCHYTEEKQRFALKSNTNKKRRGITDKLCIE